MGRAPMRFFIHEPYVLVLKQDFKTPALYLLDARTGEVKWKKTNQEAVYSVLFDNDGKRFYGLTPPKSDEKATTLIGYETETGKTVHTWKWKGFDSVPDAAVIHRFKDGEFALRAIYGEDMELRVHDPEQRKPDRWVRLTATGVYGVPGGKAVMTQGPYLVLMSPSGINAGTPEGRGQESGNRSQIRRGGEQEKKP
jgi:hypothetical protein